MTVVDHRAFAAELARAHTLGTGGQGHDSQPILVRGPLLHDARQQRPFLAGHRLAFAGQTAEFLQTQTGHSVREVVRRTLKTHVQVRYTFRPARLPPRARVRAYRHRRQPY